MVVLKVGNLWVLLGGEGWGWEGEIGDGVVMGQGIWNRDDRERERG